MGPTEARQLLRECLEEYGGDAALAAEALKNSWSDRVDESTQAELGVFARKYLRRADGNPERAVTEFSARIARRPRLLLALIAKSDDRMLAAYLLRKFQN